MIPYIRPSHHRRVKRADVLAYRDQVKEDGVPKLAMVGEEVILIG